MDVNTHLDRARSRVRAERGAADAKLDGFDSFIDRVRALSTDRTPAPRSVTATAGRQLRGESSSEDRCRAVRTAFAETIRPHSDADGDGSGSLLGTVREELTDAIAVALAPTTEATFTPGLKETVVATARTRRAEVAALREGLDREERQLDDAAAVVDDVTGWIVEVDATPLTDLGFDALERRHETLARHRDRCQELADRRQEFLRETTNSGTEAGIRHRSLVRHLYGEFPVDHPVLATVARLDDTCRQCQRAVRAHLVRRT